MARAGALAGDGLNKERMLGDRENMRPDGLSVPAGDASEPMGDVGDLDVERRRIEEIEPPPGQHPLPGAERSGTSGRSRTSAPLPKFVIHRGTI